MLAALLTMLASLVWWDDRTPAEEPLPPARDPNARFVRMF